jgi:hypothetical protein
MIHKEVMANGHFGTFQKSGHWQPLKMEWRKDGYHLGSSFIGSEPNEDLPERFGLIEPDHLPFNHLQ